MTTWLVIAALAAGTLALKASGPLLAEPGKEPGRWAPVVALLVPALLSALVVTSLVSSERMTPDARLVGLLAAGVALSLRAPLVVVLTLAAAGTAVARALGG